MKAMKLGLFALLVAAAQVAAGGSDDSHWPADAGRTMTSEVVVDGTPREAWAMFTTKEGLEAWSVPLAEVDFRMGGTIRSSYSPEEGIDGASTIVQHIVAYDPYRMFAVRATIPAHFPEFIRNTADAWGIVYFEPVDEHRTRVSVKAVGYGEGELWDKAFSFFDKGNAMKLAELRDVMAKRKSAPEAKPSHVSDLSKTSAAGDSKFGAMAKLVGHDWYAKGLWEDPSRGGMRVSYEWGLGGKLMKVKSFVRMEGEEKLVYESVMGWHPGRERIAGYCFSVWGSVYDGSFTIDGNKFFYEWEDFKGDTVARWRQLIELTSDDSYQWTVWKREGDDWSLSKESTFVKGPLSDGDRASR